LFSFLCKDYIREYAEGLNAHNINAELAISIYRAIAGQNG